VNKKWKRNSGTVQGQGRSFDIRRKQGNEKCAHKQSLQLPAVRKTLVGDVGYPLWKAGLPKQEKRRSAQDSKPYYTCRNSKIKHLKDQNMERLQWRINKTLADLKQLAKELVKEGLTTTAKFIQNSANYMITFARLAIKQTSPTYTTS